MAQPTRPGNAERGWNDPPMLLHTGSPSIPPPGPGQPAPRRNPLNKRVAHPGIFSGGGGSSQTKSASSLGDSPGVVAPLPITAPRLVSAAHPCNNPAHSEGESAVPIPAPLPGTDPLEPSPVSSVILLPPASSTDISRFTAPIIVPTMSPLEDSPLSSRDVAKNPITNQPVGTMASNDGVSIPDFDNDEQMYHFVLTRLKKTCLSCAEVVKPRVAEDINKKLDIFSNMWKDGKISYPVKSSMARLSTALHHRKCDIAHEIHLSLMMDYVSEVGQWMVGIKRLIQEARNVDAPLSPTDNTISNPFDAPEAAIDDLSNCTVLNSEIESGRNNVQENSDNTQIKGKVQLTENTKDAVTTDRKHRQSDSPATIETMMIE